MNGLGFKVWVWRLTFSGAGKGVITLVVGFEGSGAAVTRDRFKLRVRVKGIWFRV